MEIMRFRSMYTPFVQHMENQPSMHRTESPGVL